MMVVEVRWHKLLYTLLITSSYGEVSLKFTFAGIKPGAERKSLLYGKFGFV